MPCPDCASPETCPAQATKLYAWKFRIRGNEERPLPSNPDLAYRGCLAFAIAPTEEEARKRIIRRMNEDGEDSRWLEPGCANVIRLDIDESCCLGWAMI